LYRRMGGPQGRSEQMQKVSPPPEFDPRTVQPVASRYPANILRKQTYNIMEERSRLVQIMLQSSVCTLSSVLKFVAIAITIKIKI